MSTTSSPAGGGVELFIIGKNFLKGSKVFFREKDGDAVLWDAEASYDAEFFHQVRFRSALTSFSFSPIKSNVSCCFLESHDCHGASVQAQGHRGCSQGGVGCGQCKQVE